MNKNEFMDMIDLDLDITVINIEKKIYEIPGLHSKYLRLYFNEKVKLNKKRSKLDQLYKKRYYEIKDDSDDLMNQKEIIFNILGDEEYSKLKLEFDILNDLVDILDKTVKKINYLSFDIKNITEFMKFQTGV